LVGVTVLLVLDNSGGSLDKATLTTDIAAVADVPPSRIYVYNITTDGTVDLVYFQILDSSGSLSAMDVASNLYNKALAQDPSFEVNGLNVISLSVFTDMTATTSSVTVEEKKSDRGFFWRATIGFAAGLGVALLLVMIVFLCLRRKLRVANSYSIEQTFNRYKEDIVYDS
jgi:hypothetical protein